MNTDNTQNDVQELITALKAREQTKEVIAMIEFLDGNPSKLSDVSLDWFFNQNNLHFMKVCIGIHLTNEQNKHEKIGTEMNNQFLKVQQSKGIQINLEGVLEQALMDNGIISKVRRFIDDYGNKQFMISFIRLVDMYDLARDVYGKKASLKQLKQYYMCLFGIESLSRFNHSNHHCEKKVKDAIQIFGRLDCERTLSKLKR